MTKQLLLRFLKKHLSSYAGDLDAQVKQGLLSLSNIELRPARLLQGLWLLCGIGEIQAEWSWQRLLTSRFEVQLADIKVVVRLPPSTYESPLEDAFPTGPSSSGTLGSASEQGFVQQLRRRVWDRLKITVKNVHVRIELYSDEKCTAGACTGVACGLTAHTCVIEPYQDDPSKPIWQTVQLTDAGTFVEASQQHSDDLSSLRAVSWPREDCYILSGISPNCTAKRHAGRRFVDWRGLEVNLHSVSPQCRCSLETSRHAIALYRAMSSQSFKAAVDAVGLQATAPNGPHQSGPGEDAPTWNRWFGWMWDAAAKFTDAQTQPAAAVEEMDEDGFMDACDGEDLELAPEVPAEPETEPSGCDKFTLAISVDDATMDLPDINMSATWSTKARLTLLASSWEAMLELHNSEVRENRLGDSLGPLVCTRDDTGNTNIGPMLSMLAQAEGSNMQVNLEVQPVKLCLSRHVMLAAKDALEYVLPTVSYAETLTAQIDTTDVLQSTTVNWKASRLHIDVADDLLLAGRMSICLSGSGSCSAARGSHSICLDASLEDAQNVHQVLEPCTFKVVTYPATSSIDVSCDRLGSTCSLEAWLSLLNSALSSHRAYSAVMGRRVCREQAYTGSHRISVEVRSVYMRLPQEWFCVFEPISLKIDKLEPGLRLCCDVPKAHITALEANVIFEGEQAGVDLNIGDSGLPEEGTMSLLNLNIVELPLGTQACLRCYQEKDPRDTALLTACIKKSQASDGRPPSHTAFISSQTASLQLTPSTLAALQSIYDLQAAVVASFASPTDAAPLPSDSIASPAKWCCRWEQQDTLQLVVTADNLPGLSCEIGFAGGGASGLDGNFCIEGRAGVSLFEAKAPMSKWIDIEAFSLDVRPNKIALDCPRAVGRSSLLELLPVLRAVRLARMRPQSAAFKSSSTWPALSATIADMEVFVVDGESAECVFLGKGCELSWLDADFKFTAATGEFQIVSSSKLQGNLLLEQPSLVVKSEEHKMKCTAKIGPVQLTDGDSHMALAVAGFTGSIGLETIASGSKLSLTGALQGLAHLDTTADFLRRCKSCGSSIVDAVGAIWLEEPLTVEERPIGMTLRDGGEVAAVSPSSAAFRLGVKEKWCVQGTNPALPSGALIADHLRTCSLPFVVIFSGPPEVFIASVNLAPFPLKASLRSKWGVEAGLERASLTIPEFKLDAWSGTGTELSTCITSFYLDVLQSSMPKLVAEAWVAGVRAETLARTALTTVLLKVGGTGVALVGGGVAMAAAASGAGIVQSIAIAAEEGRKRRGGNIGYHFGDVSRGVVGLTGNAVGAIGRRTSSYFTGGVADNPLLFQGADEPEPSASSSKPHPPAGASASQECNSNEYRFGDLTRGLAARGRQTRGGEADGGYQFGDVTRGLLGRWRS